MGFNSGFKGLNIFAICLKTEIHPHYSLKNISARTWNRTHSCRG